MANAIKKYLYSFFIFALFGFNHVVSSGLPADHYYSDNNIPKLKENLEKIKEAADSNDDEKKLHAPMVHAPCVILIEEDNQETKNDPTIGGVTTTLGIAVQDAYVAIVVSASVLLNMVERIDPQASARSSNQKFEDLSFHKESWRIFTITGTGFILLIPQKYENLYGLTGFNITHTTEFTILLPSKGSNDYTSLKKALNNQLKKLTVKPGTLKKLIVPMPENIVRDFWIGGHGSPGGSICGTKSENIKAFLKYLNFSQESKSTTGFVGLFSCYSGGKNLNKIELSKNKGTKVLDDYNFTLMVFSTNDDMIRQSSSATQTFIRMFFNQTAQFANKGTSLDELMKSFVKFNSNETGSKHGTSNLPQIWLPHGKGFQTFNLGDKIEIINTVQTRIHKENNEPFVIKDKKAVLLYSSKIDVPINIISTKSLNNVTRTDKHFWDKLPVGTETFYYLTLTGETKAIVQDKAHYPLCAQAKTEWLNDPYSAFAILSPNETKTFIEQCSREMLIRAIGRDIRDNYLLFFPIFIPMIRQNNILAFNSISLESPKTSIGILDFIRSAFFDTANYKRNTRIFITELTGLNDIALTLEGLRARKKDQNQSACEKAFRPTAGKTITLKEVYIGQQPAGESSGIEFTDMAQQRWLYSFDIGSIQSSWDFQTCSENNWKIFRPTETTSDQKTLSDVLNQRLAQEALSTLTTALTALKTKLTELAQALNRLSNA